MNKEQKYWLAFAKTDGIGSMTLSDIYKKFGSMKEAWEASTADWLASAMVLTASYEEPEKVCRLKLATIEKFKQKQKEIDIEALEKELLKKEVKFITILDKSYPPILKQIYNPPATLFYKGNFPKINLEFALAAVGSRNCSFNAVESTKSIISELNGSDLTIVSGGAKGIDTVSHEAALNAGLKTIAVLGGGFDNLYPKSNAKLFERIVKAGGALVSEYHPCVFPEAFRFPLRNRIISGLSKGTLVSEAGEKSGALITARLCLEQNRELMCLPGIISNPNTYGTHKLLKDGAGLVTCGADILNYMGWEEKNTTCVNNQAVVDLTEEEKIVYDIISLEPSGSDKIISLTKFDVGDVMVILTTLELKGVIKQLPGETYMRIN
ncbi:MAG: DNA-processing protein DprA [Candidatus Gastranaerophilales bacterium]|nr:DNA-processing protein DprA [Candidatus Gastranaerophilales bacterium]